MIVVAAILVAAACWVITVYGGRMMSGRMPMPGGWSMSMAWMPMPDRSAVGAAAMFLGMWEIMMIAMMLPSALPLVLLHGRMIEARRAQGAPAPPAVALLAGYFTVWLAFGVVAYVLGLGAVKAAMKSDVISRVVPPATGIALIVAGFYQRSRLKQWCLTHCRSPFSFLALEWRDGWLGTFGLGIHHGAYCAGCCWALMLIQHVIGVMSLPLMVAVAGVIALEKTWRYGEALARGVGAIAVVAGCYVAVSSLIGP